MVPQTIASVSCYIVKVNCQYFLSLYDVFVCLFVFNFELPHDGEIKLYMYTLNVYRECRICCFVSTNHLVLM